MPTSWNTFYLGRLPRIDRREGDYTAERANLLEGRTFGEFGDELNNYIVDVTADDRGGSPIALDQNNAISNDRFDADIGNGLRSYVFDAATSYNATISYIDGSSVTATIVVFQATNGHTFVAPGLTDPANEPLLMAPVESITLNFVVQNTALGLAIDRPDDEFMPCFVRGSQILTPSGYRLVENLQAGDVIETIDGGVKPLIWVGGKEVDGTGVFAPIRFAPGALGNKDALLVSPQHRMLISGWRAELMFGEDEVLVPAKSLVNGETIHVQPMARVSYHHILFDSHQVVLANGILTESFHPGKHMLEADIGLRDELLALFPELAHVGQGAGWDTARCVLKTSEARLLA